MKKDFQRWHKKKSDLQERALHRFYSEREVWWCSLGANVGFEQDGKGEDFARPVVIILRIPRSSATGEPRMWEGGRGNGSFPVAESRSEATLRNRGVLRKLVRRIPRQLAAGIGRTSFIKGFSKEVFVCLPLTAQPKKGKFYHSVSLEDGRPRNAILSQIRLLDTKRLQEKIGTMNEAQFKELKQAVIRLLE